jgi:hypothetical protein
MIFDRFDYCHWQESIELLSSGGFQQEAENTSIGGNRFLFSHTIKSVSPCFLSEKVG